MGLFLLCVGLFFDFLLPLADLRNVSSAGFEPQRAEIIDFDALRAQAAAALESLQQARERQLASVARTAF
jgi:hypothetical protein